MGEETWGVREAREPWMVLRCPLQKPRRAGEGRLGAAGQHSGPELCSLSCSQTRMGRTLSSSPLTATIQAWGSDRVSPSLHVTGCHCV